MQNKNIFLFENRQAILSIISKDYLLSLFFTLITISFLSPIANKYKIIQVSKKEKKEYPYIFYHDLDHDGLSEKLEISMIPNGLGIMVYTKGGVIEQWNFLGKKISDPFLFFGDLDNDGRDEIFLATYYKDSIYFHCFNPFKNIIYFQNKAITTYYKYHDEIDLMLRKCAIYDMNNDGYNEIYFTLDTGYSKHPRRMYCFDYKGNILLKSPFGCYHLDNPIAFDLDNDGELDFFCSSSATGNCSKTARYTDYFSWLIVFNKELNFKFKPKIICEFPSSTFVVPFVTSNKNYLACCVKYGGIKKIKSSLILFDNMGNKVRERKFNDISDWVDPRLYTAQNYNDLFFFKGNGDIEKLNENLQVVARYNIPINHNIEPIKFDLDNDGIDELIFYDADNRKIVITRNDFTYPTIFYIQDSGIDNFSVIKEGKKHNQLFMYSKQFNYILKYKNNPLYYIRFAVYGGIYLCFFVIIVFIQKTQKHIIEEKYRKEKLMAELQLKSIKNQIDPHFTLNIINSIGSLFYKHDTEKANIIFGKYSKLLRSTILSSDNIVTFLSNELDYVENYIELEKFRLNDKFDYQIEIDESVNMKLKIPKTLIHTFVENAIKHGLCHSDKRGELKIKISKKLNKYLIIIQDNGVGLKQSKNFNSFGTGQGLKILNQILDLYFKLTKIKVEYSMNDILTNTGKSEGTIVKIFIPTK